MSDNRFKIVFDGALMPGVDVNTAKFNLAALFKSDVAAVEHLFNGKTVTLKHGLSPVDAQSYLRALEQTGISARIEAEPVIELNLAEVHEQAPDGGTPPLSPYAPPRSTVGTPEQAFATLKPFSVEGRIGRLRFLAWTMVLTLVMLGVGSIAVLIGLAVISAESTSGIVLGCLLLIVLGIASLVVSIQISVQRLHDMGCSGWLWLLNLVPFVGSLFPFVIMLVPGSARANQYGPPPPPNSTAVKVLSALWLAAIALFLVGAISGGIAALQEEYESVSQSSYETGPASTEEDDAANAPAAADQEP